MDRSSTLLISTNDVSVQTNRTDDTNIILKRMVFFCCKIAIQKERMVFEVKIIKQELEFEECLKQRLEFICEIGRASCRERVLRLV